MTAIALSTDITPNKDSSFDWQNVVCKVIHNVQVQTPSRKDFAARISGRRYEDVSCSRFWSKPHQILNSQETYGNAGGGGYLLSWQIRGDAFIAQNNDQIHLRPGELAIVDGRRPMTVSFTTDVERIVARLPAKVVEGHLASMAKLRNLKLNANDPLANLVQSYLSEISSVSKEIALSDLPVLADNICNLLRLLAGRSSIGDLDSRELRRQSVIRHLKQQACDPDITLDTAAAQLNMSRRLLQKILQETGSNFTEVITEERLRCAAQKLNPALHLSISDVAYTSGFNDISHFNHLFKRHFTMTPGEYRHQYHTCQG